MATIPTRKWIVEKKTKSKSNNERDYDHHHSFSPIELSNIQSVSYQWGFDRLCKRISWFGELQLVFTSYDTVLCAITCVLTISPRSMHRHILYGFNIDQSMS